MTKINLEQADENVLKFLTALLEQKGMGVLPDALIADMLLDLYTRFQNLLLISIMNEMDTETLSKFNDLVGEGAEMEKSYKFFKKYVPNMKEITIRAMDEFSGVYLGE